MVMNRSSASALAPAGHFDSVSSKEPVNAWPPYFRAAPTPMLERDVVGTFEAVYAHHTGANRISDRSAKIE